MHLKYENITIIVFIHSVRNTTTFKHDTRGV